jgi:plastocyanin
MYRVVEDKFLQMKTGLYAAIAITFVLFATRNMISGETGTADSHSVVSGHVRFDGTPPQPRKIDMSQDPACAKAHSGPATTEDIVVGSSGDLANVVVYVSDGLQSHNFESPTQAAILEQKGCQYIPHVLAVQAGQKIDIINSDETTHNIHPTPANNREWNMTQPHGMPLEQSFAREEIAIPVKCNVHPWMRGYIAVFKHPYFAVSDKNGHFELKGLPSGSYTISAWQEKLGTQTQKVTVGTGETKIADFTFK